MDIYPRKFAKYHLEQQGSAALDLWPPFTSSSPPLRDRSSIVGILLWTDVTKIPLLPAPSLGLQLYFRKGH